MSVADKHNDPSTPPETQIVRIYDRPGRLARLRPALVVVAAGVLMAAVLLIGFFLSG